MTQALAIKNLKKVYNDGFVALRGGKPGGCQR